MVSSWLLAVKPETVNLKPDIESYPLVLPPLPTASPPKGGDETLERKAKGVLVPPLGGKVVRSTKRGMLSDKGTML